MEYIRYFEEHSNHQAFIDSDLFGYAKLSYCEEEKDVVYRKYKEDPCLTFISEQDGSRVALNRSTTSATINGLLKYSTNNGRSWENYTFTKQGVSYCGLTITLNENASLMFKGTLPQTNFKFSISGKVSAKGDITSLHNGVGGDFALVSNSMNKMFHNCTGLTTAPNLPSTTLSINCYDSMFSGCTSLTTAPALPATTLASNCYQYMFGKCTSLTTAPELPATTLANSCYSYMFQGCSALTAAPELPATNLSGASSCYLGMFLDCTSLTASPALPATTLASSCYEGMFCRCTSLTAAPELPSRDLASGCYKNMFAGCTSLTTAPELPAVALVINCYNGMFSGCTSLNYIKALFTVAPSTTYTNGWVSRVAEHGTFEKNIYAKWTNTGVHAVPIGWTEQISSYEYISNNDLLSFTANENNSTIALSRIGSSTALTNATLEYSIDNGSTWNNYTLGTAIALSNVGDKVKFKGTNGVLSSSSDTNFHKFVMTGKIAASGKITSLNTNYDIDYVDNYCYRNLFSGCTSLTTAPELPATTLGTACYYSMFNGCKSLVNGPSSIGVSNTKMTYSACTFMFSGCTALTTAPELPATTLAPYCYRGMFFECTSLTTAPALPATTLSSYCYYSMFNGCTSLATAPSALPATSLSGAGYCYSNMFNRCTSLTTAPALPATTLSGYCYQYMFQGCTALTTAPELPATTLSSHCYEYMFNGCTNLTTAPSTLPATTLSNYCCYYMFSGCTSLTTAPALPATNLSGASSCYQGMFGGCTSLTTAPALPATTLSSYCYYYMFNGCTSLTTAPELPATTLQNRCYYHMFGGCTSLTTAPNLLSETLVIDCYSYMFSGCSKVNYIKAMFTTTPSASYTSNWVSGVKSTGTFVKNSAATWTTTGSAMAESEGFRVWRRLHFRL